MQPSTGIIVVGAGIAGLTAALALARRGFDVELFERTARLEEAGAGLQLSPNALRVLSRLGVDFDALDGVPANSVTLRSGRSGKPIAEVPVASTDGTAYLSLHRADLQAALLAAAQKEPRIILTLDAECCGFKSDAAGIALDLVIGGSPPLQRRAEIVIAADGVNSAIARQLGRPAARPSGDVAWRMTIPAMPEGARHLSGIAAWLGSGRHAVAYPVRGGREINLVLIGPASDAANGDLAGSATKQRLLDRFAGWDPDLLALIGAAGPASAWPLSTRALHDNPADPPGLLLIGDAAHAMLPYAAQGAAMAIEDAFVAAHCIALSATTEDAGQRFAAERAPRLRQVLRRVAFHRFVYHLPFPLSLGRDLVLGVRPKASLARDLAWLYDWVPPGD